MDDEQLQAQILAAFGVKPWDAGVAPVPLRVRLWRAVTFAYRRGKAIDWRSYNRAEAAKRAADEAFTARVAEQKREIAEQFSAMLPDGMRFEWASDEGGS